MPESPSPDGAPDPNEGAPTAAARELVRLQRLSAMERSTLARLQRDVLEVEALLGSAQAARLLEANEQLVLAALRSQDEAETAARALNEASRASELDALTGLPNRVLMLDRLARAIADAKRNDKQLALLFLDLDHFKQINDTLGHAAGDEVLKLTAQILAAAVREVDTVTRHGGDEFLILLAALGDPADAVLVADKLLAALAAPRRLGDHVLRLAASVGISIYPDDGLDADTLIGRADAAMYRAKRQGMGRFEFHTELPLGQRGVSLARIESLQRPLTHYELALAEQERLNAQLREANEQLVLAALTAQQLKVAAEQAHRRQQEFLAVLAHELRTPLSPIRTAVALLGKVRSGEPLLPWVQSVIERQVAHVSRLVEDLLDVSRINTGKLRLDRQLIEIGDVVNAAIETCRPAMDTRLQQFSVYVPAAAITLDGDPVRLTQALSNLLGNASKYTPEGGEIALTVVVEGEALVITVADTGIGITPAALAHVFDPFVQEPHAIGFNASGLGLGLTVVRELVEAHGGEIVAISAGPGRGSRFVVTLPLTTRADETDIELPLAQPVQKLDA